RRATAIQGFKQRVVTPGNRKQQKNDQRRQPAPKFRAAGQAAQGAPPEKDQKIGDGDEYRVDHSRGHARPDAGQLEPDVDMLRRFDAVMLPQIQVSRGACHVLILPRVPTRSDPLTRTSGPCSWARSWTAASTSTGGISGCSCASA